MSASNHEYSESEADAILKRALDLQASQDTSKHKKELGAGLTLEQLYRSAAEIGVDPSLVRKAAEDVTGRKVASPKTDPSAPSVIEREFLTSITEADFPALLEHLRAVTKTSGAAQVIGGTLEWNTMTMVNRELLHVVAIPASGSTTIRIRSTNPFAQMPIRKPFLIFPILILAMGLVPSLTFGGRFFSWFELLPFLFIAAIAALIPLMLFSKMSPFRAGTSKSEQLMDSIGDWIRARG